MPRTYIQNSRGLIDEKVRPIVLRLPVSLVDLYTGGKKLLAKYKRTILCQKCYIGMESVSIGHECQKYGQGIENILEFNFTNKLHQVNCLCFACGGCGTTQLKNEICKECNGERIIIQNNSLEVHIEKGMQNMQELTFENEGNQNLEGEFGNVIVVLLTDPHDCFERVANDLLMKNVEISLTQALCGLEYIIQHLDGRYIVIRSSPGCIIKCQQIKRIIGEGMPIYESLLEKGDLLIQFAIKFPENNFATQKNIYNLEKLLPARTAFTMPLEENVIKVDLSEIKPRNHEENFAGSSSERIFYEIDNTLGNGTPNIQCSTQ